MHLLSLLGCLMLLQPLLIQCHPKPENTVSSGIVFLFVDYLFEFRRKTTGNKKRFLIKMFNFVAFVPTKLSESALYEQIA